MDVVAIITARGGSKGIPRKNLVPLAGKPLIAWTIEAALKCEFERVIVSTDNDEIADVSRNLGAEVPFIRPAELAVDTVGSYEVVEHALKWINKHSGSFPPMFVLLQPTSPFRTSKDIVAAINLVKNSNAPGAIGVCEAETHPWMTRKIATNGSLHKFVQFPDGIKRRQDYPRAYRVNGAVYAIRTEVFLEKKTFEPEGTVGYVMPIDRSVDIDLPADLEFAEWIAERKSP